MRLVPAKCTQCNGNLQVDADKDAAICPYCGTPFVVEKAINLYNTTVIGKQINNYFVSSGNDIQRAFEKAEGCIRVGAGEIAIETIKKLTQDYMGEYQVWKRLLDYSFAFVETWRDYKTYHISSFRLRDTIENAMTLCPSSEKLQLKNYIDGFFDRVYNRIVRGELYITRLLGLRSDAPADTYVNIENDLQGLNGKIDDLIKEGQSIATQLNEMGISYYGGRFVLSSLKDFRMYNISCRLEWLIGNEIYGRVSDDGFFRNALHRSDHIARNDKDFYKTIKGEAKRNSK